MSFNILLFNRAQTKTLLHESMGSLYTRSKDTKREPQIWHYFRNGGLGPAVPQQKAISGSAPQVSDASQHKFN